MRLLLISNSTNPGEPYLDYPKNNIKEFLGNNPVKGTVYSLCSCDIFHMMFMKKKFPKDSGKSDTI